MLRRRIWLSRSRALHESFPSATKPHVYAHWHMRFIRRATHIHARWGCILCLPQLGWKTEGRWRKDGDREEERHSGIEGMWRKARWREEPQYAMRVWERGGKEKQRRSISILPYFFLNLNCRMIYANITVGVSAIIFSYLHLKILQLMLHQIKSIYL